MLSLLMLLFAHAAPLQLDEVLDAVDARIPTLAAAEAQLEVAEAKLLSKRGAFDPYLSAKASTYISKDPRQIVDTSVSGDTLLGVRWLVGYRAGLGQFPAYDGDAETYAGGEMVAGVDVPLLRGMWRGEARTDRDAATWRLRSEEQLLEATRIEVRLVASAKYWKWVGAIRKLEVDEELLRIAENRATVLQREVEAGSRARIHLLDNERVLLERQANVAESSAKAESAAYELSVYLRLADGQVTVPSADRAPPITPPMPRSLEDDIGALSGRPDLVAMEHELKALDQEIRGARNGLLPDLSVSVAHAQPVRQAPAETIVGVSVSTSLVARKQRGDLNQLSSKSRAVESKLGGSRDKAIADVQAGHAELLGAIERSERLQDAAARSAEVAGMEARRFELGGSDLFDVLQREEKLAKARKQAIDAAVTARLVDARINALIGR